MTNNTSHSLYPLFIISLSLIFFLSFSFQALVQALEQESTDLFSELVKNVNYTGIQVGELLSNHETSLSSRIEGQIHRLEQEVVQFCWKSEELSRLADMQDHICFLKVMSVRQGVSFQSYFTITLITGKMHCQYNGKSSF